MNVLISKIRLDGGTQNRVHLNEEAVSEYADAITEGAQFPPVTVFFDGSDYWLADGFHRYHANGRIGALSIEADVHNGTKRAAILHSVGVNASHGLRRTNADKRKAVETLLNDEEWGQWPQKKIAEACGVSREYVSRVSNELSASCDRSQDRIKTVDRGGKQYQQNTSNIGKTAKHDPEPIVSSKAPVIPLKPKSHDSEIEQEIMKDFDPLAELEEAQKEIERLQAQIKAMCKDDLAKQVQKEVEIRQGIEARLAQEMDRSNRFDGELRRYGRFAAELRKMLRVETNAQVTARIKSLMEAA